MRKPREKCIGAVYHVVARANRGEFILNTSGMKNIFLEVLLRAKRKFPFKLKHFCIMSNHIHLLIEPALKTDLSKLMQWVLSVFALKFNRLYHQKGHVWYDRFKSKIIKSFNQFVLTFEYITENPVKAKICDNALFYRFGGLHYIRQKKHDLVAPPESFIDILFPEIAVSGGALLPDYNTL